MDQKTNMGESLPFFEEYRICGPLQTDLCTIALFLTSSSLANTSSKFLKLMISAILHFTNAKCASQNKQMSTTTSKRTLPCNL